MDEAMLLPLAERELAFRQSGNRLKVLRSSQCYISYFSNRQRVAFFWLTSQIARRYIAFRDTLLRQSQQGAASLGCEITEVSLTPSYSHSSPLDPQGQRVLIEQFNRKVHAFWIDTGELEAFVANHVKAAFDIMPLDARLDLQWHKVNMDDATIDEVYTNAADAFVNVEPHTFPVAPPYAHPHRPFTPAEQDRWNNASNLYRLQLRQLQTSVRNCSGETCGLLEITLGADGLVCSRSDYPKAKTPTLTWKQIRKVIRKPRNDSTDTGKRRVVLVQKKGEVQ